MTKQELQKKYGDEEIFVVNSNDIVLYSGFKSYDSQIGQQYIEYLKHQGFFIKRYDAEFNPRYKQIIPYCLVKSGNTGAIYMTQRIKGDSRLIGRVSIGQGGHINPIDDDSNNIILSGIKRELNEELGIVDKDIAEIFLRGTIYDPSDEVGKDHLGLIFQVTVINDDIKVAEKDTLEGSWAFIKKLKDNYDNMENWSKIVFDNVVMA